MPDVATRTILAAIDLPRPPGAPEQQGGLSTATIVAIVIAVLGGVVLIAWLLKPLVARRLTAPDSLHEPESRRAEPVSRSTPEMARQEVRQIAVPIENDVIAQPSRRGPEAPGGQPTISGESPEDVSAEEIAGITLTVRELLDHANAGQLLRGFALYSESFLQRFRAETGLSEEEFRATYGDATPAPPEARAELAAVTQVERRPGGRLSALVTYRNGGAAPAPERFVFVRAEGGRWLIDDIITAG
jgi:hypothetical protein